MLHKINYFETRSYLNDHIMRENLVKSYPDYGSKFEKSFFPYFTKKWETLNRSEQNANIFDEFKVKL